MTSAMPFGSLTIEFDAHVLEPRPWVLLQSEWAAELLEAAPPGRVLELCTGAGHIGLAAVVDNERELVAVDADPDACEWARRNAEANGLGARVEVRHVRLEDAVGPDESFVLVIADPPWVPRADVGRFPEDPVLAIDGGTDGLDVARACLDTAARALVHGGSLLLQLGNDDQARALDDARFLEVDRRQGERGIVVRLDVASAPD
ncbi:MAG: methyltransferase small [Nocardioides sp.]|jgi:HemK-like putative methylase|uniref:methyltransferase n=1 Tax=Nocardioides sp. TaxID=35761 RepID=UPI0026150EEA|nr:methyltransferase [Nocardioides sp.]MCW2834659.1 methyltransferase small [Nocardioides sp.]